MAVHVAVTDRPPAWPDDLLDVPALRAGGWRPVPFRQFLFKVHSRCNLACDYCYVYEMADQSWRSRPFTMRHEVVARAAERIAEHVRRHQLDEVHVILHGGEPLLAGAEFLDRTVTTLRTIVGAQCRVEFGMQTNAVLLCESILEVLLKHRVRVGVSLDGGRSGTDRHRRYRDGRGSYDEVAAGLRWFARDRFAALFTGLLCTIDLANDPVTTFEELLTFTPPSVDFLLPHGNWSAPPPGRPDDATTPYADWLIPIFDRWYGAPRRETGIRFFEEIINLVLGGRSHLEAIGLTAVNLIVVEGDGTLEQVDSLKAAYDGAPATGLNVFDHSFDQALDHPAVVARQIGVEGLCATCRQCPIRDVCGGGLYPHRYRDGAGFLNPSVYCPDLLRLIRHIADRVRTDIGSLQEP